MGIFSGSEGLETFPANRNEALAMLYLQHYDGLARLTPEELAELYLDVKTRIGAQFVEMSRQKRETAT